MQPNFSLAPMFKSPDPAKFNYQKYESYIEEGLPPEIPQLYGMHPNAEIGYLNQQGMDLLNTILEVQAGSKGAGGAGQDDQVLKQIDDLLDRRPKDFNMITIMEKVKEEKTPFEVVALQEIERMNTLLDEIRKSLEELKLGLQGALNVTEAMEQL